MDLNELLFQHQRALMLAAGPRADVFGSQFDLVGHYADRIKRLRVKLGVCASPDWLRAA